MHRPEQQHICTRPFEWFEVHPNGSVFLCCPAWLKRSIGNLLTQPLEAIWNGPVAQEIRKTIFNGSFHSCSRSRCPYLAEPSGPVCAPVEVSCPEIEIALAERHSQLPYLPRNLNLCFDHSCNLACPSCRQTIQQARGTDLGRAEQISAILMTSLVPHVHSITLSGFGDPFGSPTYFNILQQINPTDFPNLQQIRLHTNGLLLTEQLWNKLPALSQLVSEIEVSIDAASEATYQLNRPGGNFSQLMKNLDFIARQNCQLTLSMVVQNNNWREIPRLLERAQRLNARIYLSRLVNWGTFSRSEFSQRAVHLATHPDHPKLQQLLDQIKTVPGVNLGNLNGL